jgi:hypothetical protein
MISTESIAAHLRRRSQWRTTASWLRTIFAIPILFIPGLILGTVFWITMHSLTDFSFPWSWFFLGFTVLCGILTFAQEIKRGPDYLGEIARTTTPAPSMMDTGVLLSPYPVAAIRIAMSPRMAAAGWVEIFLTGPRMFLNGFRHLQVMKKLSAASIDRCANLLAALLAAGTSAPIEKLSTTVEFDDDLTIDLAWLTYFGWVQVSEKRDRVILFTESKEILQGGSK